jgi:hypothetical protein
MKELIDRKVFLCSGILILVVSSICNQLISSFTCRPFQIIYDRSFMSMIFIQIIAFLFCLFFIFMFARMYGPLIRHYPEISDILPIPVRTKLNRQHQLCYSTYNID